MNEYEYLIYHYSSKNQQWYDATKDIVNFERDKRSWNVKFVNRNKFIHVSYQKMRVYDQAKEIEFADLYYKNSPCPNVKKLILFNNRIYKIFYQKGYTCVAFPDEIKIIKDTLKNDEKATGVMAYYRRVVKETGITEEDDFLLSQFDDISYINEESVLALYLKGQLAKSNDKLQMPVISPFGLNMSQSKALEMAFDNRISIIEGPPGTGKTQTILNIISNAVIKGKTAAVVSNNNSATDNVYEKLDKYGFSFICAPLGNRENVESFFDNYDSSVPQMKKENVDIHKLNNLYLGFPRYFEKENKKKKLLSLIDSLELEYKHFLNDNPDLNSEKFKRKINNINYQNVQEIIVKIKEKGKLGFFDKIFVRRKLKVNISFFNLNKEKGIVILQNLYYLSRINQAKKEIQDIDKYMKGQSLEEKVKIYSELSRGYFNNFLFDSYCNNNRGSYNKGNYKRFFSDFVNDFPIVLSSTYSLAKCSQRGFLFDYLIVDESSQVNMASAILSMRVAKNLIVVGDIKQLPQIDDSTFDERNKELLKEFNVSNVYSYQGNSIMSSLLALYGESIPRQMLKEHYRCAPEIINFCNKEFYNNELIIYTNFKDKVGNMRVIKTTPGNHARKNTNGSGIYNQREIDEISELIKKENLEDVGVITPYRYQASLIQREFGNEVESSTIHKFQGREKKTIIFSSVVNDVNDFVGNDNLINVAVSRAIDKFILITSDKVFNSKSGVLADLVNYISYNQNFGKIEDGSVKSIYDILYNDYEEQLIKFRKKHPSKDFDTENITKELLKNILKDYKYRSLWFRMHVSLRDFIKNDGHNLSNEEYKFYINPNSHADFLIYNKMSRKPVLVIEVDGISFHEQQEKQKVRDLKKDSVLSKVGIPILRLKTNESNEAKRIINTLNKILEE